VSDSRGPGRQCFAEVLVSGLSGQLITSYTVPLMKKSSLLLVSVSGENKAEYTIKINGVTIGVVRTYYTYYNENFACNDLELLQNDTVTVTVENKSNTPAIFNATIFYKEFE
jgi:predicted metal-dependent hydrolase